MQIGFTFSRLRTIVMCLGLMAAASTARGDNLPIVSDVEFQPFSAQVKRVVESLEMLGQPLTADEKTRLGKAIDSTGGAPAIRTIQQILDPSLPGRNRNQRGKPRQVDAGPGPPASRPAWMVGLSGQGAQPGRRHRRARR